MMHNINRLYIIKIAKWFMLTMPILMIFYDRMGFNAQQSFIIKACYSVSIVVFEIPSGYAADVWGRKITLVIGSILGTVGFVIYSLTDAFGAFVAAELILGLGMSFISGADSALMYDSLKAVGRHDEYVKYEGRNFSVGNFSEAIAGLIGGALATASIRYPFYAQTLVAFTAVPAALTLVEPPAAGGRRPRGTTDIIKVLRHAFVENIPLKWNIIYSSILGSATLAMAWVYPLRLAALGFSELQIGTMHTALNLVLGAVTLFAYRIELELKPKRTIWLSTVSLTVAFVLAGLAPDSCTFATIMVLFYACRGIATPVLKDYVNRLTSSDIRATVLSVRSLIIRGFFAIVAPFFGTAADLFGIGKAFVILGIIYIAATGLCINKILGESHGQP